VYEFLKNLGEQSYAGVLSMFCKPNLCLLYHRVGLDLKHRDKLFVSSRHFEEQVKYLKLNYDIVKFSKICDQFENKVAITFDDGYIDNYCEAASILAKYSVPATFFVTSSFVQRLELPWWDRLDQIWRKLSCDSQAFFQREFANNHSLLKVTHKLKDREEIIDTLATRVGVQVNHDCVDGIFMSINQLKDLSSSDLFEVASHTSSHIALSYLSPEAQKEEILRGMEDLSAHFKISRDVFAYPFGGEADFNKATIKICDEIGFKLVAANIPGQIYPWTDRFVIPRHVVSNWNFNEFLRQFRRMKTYGALRGLK
jgi:peptidoglycan/xylan/chitin deacetylase (PgdA/CDA1 family)